MSGRRTTSGRRAVSRRGFMRLVAASSAALAAAPAAALAAAAATSTAGLKKPALKPQPARPALREETQREIERQKKSTLETLKALRDYPLPPGSDMAFVFRPLRPVRRGRAS